MRIRRRFFHFAGLTLIELLVALAILAGLIALLLPAIQAAREAARRVTCSHQLRQIAIALHSFHGQRSFFPPGAISSSQTALARNTRRRFSIPDGATHGWLAFLLPHLEQQSLADQYTWNQDWRASDNEPVRTTVLPLLLCPSAPNRQRLDEFQSAAFGLVQAAVSDYAVDNAISSDLLALNLIDSESAKINRGVMRADELHTFADIRDGAAHTMWICECAGRPERYVARGQALPAGRRSGGGWADRDNEFITHGYSHSGLTTPGPCAVNCTNDNEIYAFHPGGALCMFGDGSVRFVAAAVDIRIVARWITKAAREIAADD